MFSRLAILLMTIVLAAPALAQTAPSDAPRIPNFWDPQDRLIKPDVRALPRMRFLTVTDFPPFSFVDDQKRLVGFHIDLARAICAELELLPVCQIQALPFGELEAALRDGKGDALLAGTAITPATRRNLDFSKRYFRLPARFVGRIDTSLQEPLTRALSGKTVAVVAGTAHAAFAKATFDRISPRAFPTLNAAFAALKADQVDAMFADGLATSFLLQREEATAAPCCRFVGGPYLSKQYFPGELAVALPKDNRTLRDAVDYALRSINDKGIFAELYLRWFPVSLY
ncbi:putative amino acid-binding periplasmic protein [Ahrensia sp. R2A130]|nr:putative amino acid-binding periplasmic protein [Ahrensia sp. R2A130]